MGNIIVIGLRESALRCNMHRHNRLSADYGT